MDVNNGWKKIIDEEKEKDYFKKIESFLLEEFSTYRIYPKKEDVFKCFELTDLNDVKVVILGQDPYHGENQAHGLCFSVNKGIKIPRSLMNIYKELKTDLGCSIPSHGNLTKWANEGVLLLNTIMSVRESTPMSHANKGWEVFTDRVIQELNDDNNPKVFLLWGNASRVKKVLITNPKHLILECPHPSPYSASSGFFGCRHFSKTNEFLKANNREEIDWQIE